ncbi:COMM domain-containing protein 4 [Condylostylus longicornis]|uniref:COMM domain-containing protein 4 n=1 Tax=Condylostylus longicornis TaxID=2530218 RepID=UPI00244E023C|nr:COMM domain-containing protein 4 [Condylostylus longicornis]
MKFRFCGDCDCPDWVLSEIHCTLSTLSAIKLRILASEVAKSIIDGCMGNEEKIKDMFESSNDGLRSAKSAIACVRFLLINASENNADEATFNEELQQLGLPKEHSLSICRVHAESVNPIKKKLLEQKFNINELISVSGTLNKDAIDCCALEFKIKDELHDGVPKDTTHKINIHKADVTILLNNLKEMRNLMDSYNFERKYEGSENN